MQFFLLTFSLQFCKLNDFWLNDFCLRPQNHDPKIIKKVVKICFVRLNFIKKYCIVIFIGNEKSRCVRVATYIHSVTVRTEVVSMVEYHKYCLNYNFGYLFEQIKKRHICLAERCVVYPYFYVVTAFLRLSFPIFIILNI